MLLMPREIQCFVRVADRLGFSRAAADLGMSQPAVSQAVTRLEKALGVRLFERSARAVRLTPQGRALLGHAVRVVDAVGALEEEAARLSRPAIRLAYPPLAGPLAARIARRLAARVPAVAVDLQAAGRGGAARALREGEVSVAILGLPAPAGLTTATRFHVTVDHLAVPAAHRGDPRSLPLLLPRHRPAGSAWARLAAARHRTVAEELDDFGPALDLVAAGQGALPVPSLLTRTVRRDDVRFVPIEEDGLRLAYGVVWAAGRVSPELVAVVQAVQDALWTR
ncbi:LysR family transcriptional regulator [Thermoactinospora rubra]|uniref:LysR family transcriptional regulator n=1 Tax=Thermoactinospora rubra TaxID=1088767 RepID=UPI001301BDDF|nr:LysR family transcriptional regulator [Thermoactinospora rubra]